MLKWFILTVAVLLSVIVALAWRLSTVSSQVAPTASSVSQVAAVSPTFTDAQVKDLFHKRGCVNCHDSKNTLVGPSFAAIAERYQDAPRAQVTLLTSVREGSEGRWGAAAMPRYSPRSVSDAEAAALLEWILDIP